MLHEHMTEAVAAIQARCSLRPMVAIILGSGLGALAGEVQERTEIPYSAIPHFATSTVTGHVGQLILGKLCGVSVVVMQGRFHLYEGYDPATVTFPVRVMSMLGAHTLLVSNAAGGVNPSYKPGDLMVIKDHINLPGMAGANPLRGSNDPRLGERFPAVAGAYDKDLRLLARQVAATIPDITLHEGIYTMVVGPNFETAAELKFLRIIGSDAVGMSTVPEVLVARHMGMRVFGVSLITNTATGEEIQEVNHNEVLATAEATQARFIAFMQGIVGTLP